MGIPPLHSTSHQQPESNTKMNSIILITSALIGFTAANNPVQMACGMAPLLPKIYAAVDARCETKCSDDARDEALCPTNPCTVQMTIAAAGQAGDINTMIGLVNMAMAGQGALPGDIVIQALANPTGPAADGARDCLLGFAAVL